MVGVLLAWATESATKGTAAPRKYVCCCEGEQVEGRLVVHSSTLVLPGDVKRCCFWSGVEAGAGATIPGRSGTLLATCSLTTRRDCF
jgi:hypothetical protein